VPDVPGLRIGQGALHLMTRHAWVRPHAGTHLHLWLGNFPRRKKCLKTGTESELRLSDVSLMLESLIFQQL
jgi:hypothetical protein